MTDYKLIALDMDGTALTGGKVLLDSTAEAIRAAAGRGKTVALCTGRCVPELAPYRPQLEGVRYAIASSGAVLFDLAEDRCLHAEGLDRRTVLRLTAVAARFDAMAHLLTEDASVVRADQAARVADYGMGPYQQLYDAVSRKVPDIEAEAAKRPYVPKVNIYFRSPEDRAAALPLLRALPLSIDLSQPAGLEMTPPGVTKGAGLRRLAERLGVGMEEVIAVGDGDNDRSMLMAAGLAVAVANAEPSVLALADAVVADNDHDGVGQAIREYLLG